MEFIQRFLIENHESVLRYTAFTLFALIGFTLHELGHAYMALLFGDDTAKTDGRLSANPFHHLDFVGTICIILFRFGWAKPVRFDPSKLKNRKLGIMAIAFAGPLANILQVVALTLITRYFVPHDNYDALIFFLNGIVINLSMAVFNLLPFPPLDGSKIVASLLPRRMEESFYRYQTFFSVFIIILIATDWLDFLIETPISFFMGIIEKVIF